MKSRCVSCLLMSSICLVWLPARRASAQDLSSQAPAACPASDPCKAAQGANDAAKNANNAAGAAKDAADQANQSARKAADAADQATAAVMAARGAAGQANTSASDATGAAAKANSAAGAATQSIKALDSAMARGRFIPRHASARKVTIDDFIPCLFDEREIYDLRSLEQPPEAPAPTENSPLTGLQAAALAQNIAQQLGRLATPDGGGDGSATNAGAKPQKPLKQAQPVAQTETQKQISQLVGALNAEEFVGKFSSEIPGIVLSEARKQGVQDNSTSTLVQNIAATAVAQLQAPRFDRPDDISCSFSLQQWHETSDTFGRRVANTYVALEVNVRNLNPQMEFLIHDIQIAVDTGLTRAQFGRFQAARDKLVVRNVAQRGQSEDRRNVIINVLQAIGAIAGGASTALTQGNAGADAAINVASGVAIFQGPFITGLINIFPDHTLEHINHINDLAFSASTTSKTVVPIQGSIPLVTFLAEKPLEQLPFAYCGTNARKTRSDYISLSNLGKKDNDVKDPGSSQYSFCKVDYAPFPDANGQIQLDPDYYMKPLPFRNWQGAALRIMGYRTFVVIAGVHIQEVASSAQVNKVACPPGNDVNVDATKADSSGTITCTLNGSHLDKAGTSVKLEQQGKTTITGTLKAATDGNSATITIKTNDVTSNKASGKYELFLTDSTGSDTDSKQALNFTTSENVNSVTVSKVSCPPSSDANVDAASVKSGAVTCNLAGSHLDQVASVKLEQGANTISGTTYSPASDGNSATVSFKVSETTAAGKFDLTLVDKSNSNVASKQQVVFPARKAEVQGAAYKPTTLSAVAANKSLQATLTGSNLDLIQSVSLNCGSITVTGTLPSQGSVKPTDVSMTVQFNYTAVNAVAATLKATPALKGAILQFKTADSASPQTVPGTISLK
jgi:hypothetical protein